MLRFLFCLSILFCLSLAWAGPVYSIPIVLEQRDIEDVYDGDTFYIRLNGIHPVFGQRLPIRIKGIDAPERRSSCDTPALRALEREAASIVASYLENLLYRASSIRLEEIERNVYFRVDAKVIIDGMDIGQAMLEAGMVQPSVDKRVDWCPLVKDFMTGFSLTE